MLLLELDSEADSPARGLVQLILQLGERHGDRLRESLVPGVCLHGELFMAEQFLVLLVRLQLLLQFSHSFHRVKKPRVIQDVK